MTHSHRYICTFTPRTGTSQTPYTSWGYFKVGTLYMNYVQRSDKRLHECVLYVIIEGDRHPATTTHWVQFGTPTSLHVSWNQV